MSSDIHLTENTKFRCDFIALVVHTQQIAKNSRHMLIIDVQERNRYFRKFSIFCFSRYWEGKEHSAFDPEMLRSNFLWLLGSVILQHQLSLLSRKCVSSHTTDTCETMKNHQREQTFLTCFLLRESNLTPRSPPLLEFWMFISNTEQMSMVSEHCWQ